MKKITELTTLNMVEDFLDKNELSFLYVSTPNCSTCHAILPKLRELLDDYPLISLGHIEITEVKEIAEKFSIFTAPIMILMIKDKEYIREDRFVRFELLKDKLDRIYDMYTH
ncbi:thioredoxin family protein [Gracilibacillus alcaliphilus]|uniref:thioredoxin family protein n=1 Tax=Gracilibacillus alcaliphilus TaxID=1401441 RepID=UPI00195D3C02|nr:thioredoxin family protein [Gracilibacillus alcaliphilus]MBM7678169.1 thiol-disulfide isomerase/thioredoxin [Gracilibacillus alcaliphilus]